LVVVSAPPTSTDDRDKSNRQSLSMSLLFVSVILTRGALLAGQLSWRQTSDDNDRNSSYDGNGQPS
jgi:hypothetical protein